ncbi:MAG: HAD-IC family P-type ATPase [Lachnospiraceae bacterium]
MTGLTKEQVAERKAKGLVNIDEMPEPRSYKKIIKDNTLTFFNFLNIALFALIISVGSVKNSFFVTIIFTNTIIGIFQEIRAKKTLDNLAILTTSKARIIRESVETTVDTEEIVLNDIIRLRMGDQVPADVVIREGSLEVNESLITGESDNLIKGENDGLYSGSFVTAGEALCEVIHVGRENYVSRITAEAKEFRKHDSQLRNFLNGVLKVVSIIIVPLGAAVFYKQYFLSDATFQAAVVNSVAAVLGMIPEGLVLLTSIALTLGSLKLAQQKVLVQELFCIETLAHVDTLCLDKTGTITEGSIRVEEVVQLQDGDLTAPMGNMMSVLHDHNATFDALHEYFPPQEDFVLHHIIPFSSDRKYSGACFSSAGTYLIGAVQFLFPDTQKYGKVIKTCAEHASRGFRVLVLGHSTRENRDTEIPADLEPIGILLLSDVVRNDAEETLAFFDGQGVDIKVISGDDPVTVSAVARKAGLKNADHYVDATTLKTKEELYEAVHNNSVFGRVTPLQKKQMVQALKYDGHTVAMTGDGVNDVLALKESDCSIAMASGSEAAKNVANIVLLNSDFAAMPHVLNQGRRVINNIRMASSMFLIKTVFSFFLSLLLIFFGDAYPFEPIQMSIISACAVGIPTFLLAKEANFERILEGFVRRILLLALPTALTITICVFALMQICQHIYNSNEMLATACVLVTGWTYMEALGRVYPPKSLYRKTVIYGVQIMFFGGLLLGEVLFGLFNMKSLQFPMIIIVFTFMTVSPLLVTGITRLFDSVISLFKKQRNKRYIRLKAKKEKQKRAKTS